VGSDDAIDASVVDNYYNVDENDGLSDKKNEKRYKQKIVSGLGEILKHLTGECKECEEDGESDSTAVIETDPETSRHPPIPSELSSLPHLSKYMVQRYRLFSRYDEGVRLNPESW